MRSSILNGMIETQVATQAAARTIICVAPNGAWAQKKDNPATPLSPREIADDVAACARAGAAVAHVHARTPDGKPTQDLDTYREIARLIRERCDIVVQLSIGTRGFAIDDALQPIGLRPEMASFPLRAVGPADAGDRLKDLVYMAQKMTAAGVRPELDASSTSMIDAALELRGHKILTEPLCFGLVLKEPDTAREAVKRVHDWSSRLPQDSLWWVAKGGRWQLEARAAALALGGHVRVGFEDSHLEFDGAGPARSNAHLVERIASLSRAIGREPASPAEARRMIAVENKL
jgi:3-keto-5-aminohexanoate cleavage enzyme